MATNHEHWLNVQETEQLGGAAIGAIEPAPRIARGEIDAAQVDHLVEALRTDELYVSIDDEHGPNAGGGTFTLVVADALTATPRFHEPGLNAAEHAKRVYGFLMEHHNNTKGRRIIPRVCIDGRLPVEGSAVNKAVVGGHDDEHGPDGCGFQKHLPTILKYIAERGDDVRTFLSLRGVDVSESTHQVLVRRSGLLLTDGYTSPATALRGAMVEAAGENAVTMLAGGHMEVAEGINVQAGRTLNRHKIREEFGIGYDVFGLDVVPLQESAALLSLKKTEEDQRFGASMYLNVAAGLVLGGPSLRTAIHP